MVTHELTVFPDGRIDGAFSVREGDYNSHTLRFVLTQDLTAASAKLLLWPAGAAKPTVYGVLLGHGQAAGQDAQFYRAFAFQAASAPGADDGRPLGNGDAGDGLLGVRGDHLHRVGIIALERPVRVRSRS